MITVYRNANIKKRGSTYMNQKKMLMAGIDTCDGIQRFGGNKQLYEKFLYGFLSDPNYSIMLNAINKCDTSSAFQAAHALKGIAGNLSLIELYKNIVPLVELLRNNSTENVNFVLDPVKNSYKAIFDALSE